MRVTPTALLAIGMGLLASSSALGAITLGLGGDSSMPGDSSSPSMQLIEPSQPDDSATPAVDITTKLTIPSIAAVGSSMDEAAIRDALTGNFQQHAADVAKLTATSITIPEISLAITATTSGAPVTTTVSYKDIVLSGVKDGVADSVSIGSATSTTEEGSFAFGAISAKALDIGTLLSFYSVVPATSTDTGFKPMYKDFVFAGGKFTGPDASCSIGQVSAAEFDARPLKVPLAQFTALTQSLKDTKPTPEQMRTIVDFLIDIFTAFKSEPITMDGLSCSGTGEDKQPFAFSVGKLAMDGYQPGIYPGITATDLKLSGGGDGAIALAEATFKQTDLTQPLKALQDAGATLTPEWFETNYRLVVPAFAGFSFKGLSVDVPGEGGGDRVKVNVADFDLTLGNYVNGIPTAISSVSHGIDVPLPANSEDESVKTLLALGMTHVNLNYEFGINWDQASQTINVSKIAVSGNDLGSVAVAALIGNATPDLFSLDTNAELAAGQSVTLKSFGLDLADAGIADRFMPLLAAQEGVSDPAEYRTKMGGALEGAVLGILGSTDEARAVGAAIGDFVSGKAKSLSLKVDAVSPAGLPLPLVMQAQSDPSVLRGEVTVSGSAH